MSDNTQDNQRFIDAARERDEDTLMYMDSKSGEGFLVSGSPASIRLLGEIIDDYELLNEVAQDVAAEISRIYPMSEGKETLKMLKGDTEHAC